MLGISVHVNLIVVTTAEANDMNLKAAIETQEEECSAYSSAGSSKMRDAMREFMLVLLV
jgi:hypothetical protein